MKDFLFYFAAAVFGWWLAEITLNNDLTPEQVQIEEQQRVSAQADRMATIAEKYINVDLTYVIDHRTNLCFTMSSTSDGYKTFAQVECTPEVKNLAINKQR